MLFLFLYAKLNNAKVVDVHVEYWYYLYILYIYICFKIVIVRMHNIFSQVGFTRKLENYWGKHLREPL